LWCRRSFGNCGRMSDKTSNGRFIQDQNRSLDQRAHGIASAPKTTLKRGFDYSQPDEFCQKYGTVLRSGVRHFVVLGPSRTASGPSQNRETSGAPRPERGTRPIREAAKPQSACTDLCGGRSAMIVSTATLDGVPSCPRWIPMLADGWVGLCPGFRTGAELGDTRKAL